MKRVAALLILALAPFVSACVTTRAQAPVERPALEVPPVPPRILEPADTTEATVPEPVPDLPPPPTNPAPARPPVRDDAPREPAKPEPKPGTPAEPTQTPPAPASVPPLRIPGNTDGEAAERQVRETLSNADGLLNRVDYQKLNGDRKKAYDEAKLFMQSSEAALKEANFERARELAAKAEKYARELQGR